MNVSNRGPQVQILTTVTTHQKNNKSAAPNSLTTPTHPAGAYSPKQTSPFGSAFLPAVILAGIAFLVYANTLHHGFVMDDYVAIVNNKVVAKGIGGISEIWSTPYRAGYSANAVNNLYRPLTLSLFASLCGAGGGDPSNFHLVNVLLFVGCTLSLFAFLKSFLPQHSILAAFGGALIFAVHPIHTEVVANIKSADELLCFLFGMSGLLAVDSFLRRGNKAMPIVAAACLLLSLLSKETGLTFAVAAWMVWFMRRASSSPKAKLIGLAAATAVPVAIFLVLRNAVLQHFDGSGAMVHGVSFADNVFASPGAGFASRLATGLWVLGKYMLLLVFPSPLVCDYSFASITLTSFANPMVWVALATITGMISFVAQSLRTGKNGPIAFGIAFFFITISLFTNIPFLIGTAMGERLAFSASAGFCMAFPLVVDRFLTRKLATAKYVFIPVALVFGTMTLLRNRDWADNYTLYKADLVKAPQSARLNFYLGLELSKKALDEHDSKLATGYRNEAIFYLRTAVAVLPEFGDAQAALGTTFGYLGNLDSAEVHMAKAVEIFPNDDKNLNNLAYVHFSRKDFGKATELYKRAIAVNPSFINPYLNIADCYFSANHPDSALSWLHQATSVDAGNFYPYLVLARYYKSTQNADSFAKYKAIVSKLKGR